MANMDPHSSILDIDVGNSRIKWRLRVDRQRARAEPSITNTFSITCEWPTAATRAHSRFERRIAGRHARRALAIGCNHISEWRPSLRRTTRFAAGVTCGYEDPTRLGVDRWLSVLAARQLSKRPFIVIGLGTAGTLDFVDADGVHKGGFIVPGLRLMTEALFAGTADVHVDFEVSSSQAPGTNTPRRCASRCRLDARRLRQRFDSTLRVPRVTQVRTSICAVVTPTSSRRSLKCPVEIRPELVLDGLALALP